MLNWRVTFHNKMDSLRIHFNKKIMLEDLDFGIFCFFLQIGSQDNLFAEDVFKSRAKSGIKRSFQS